MTKFYYITPEHVIAEIQRSQEMQREQEKQREQEIPLCIYVAINELILFHARDEKFTHIDVKLSEIVKCTKEIIKDMKIDEISDDDIIKFITNVIKTEYSKDWIVSQTKIKTYEEFTKYLDFETSFNDIFGGIFGNILEPNNVFSSIHASNLSDKYNKYVEEMGQKFCFRFKPRV